MKYMNFIMSLDFWKSFAAPIVALLVVLISNIVVLMKIRLDSRAAIRKEMSVSLINLTKERLIKFYDPMVTLLTINRDMFNTFGPKSFPQETHLRIEAVEVWNKIIDEVILPNNKKICELVLQHSHLIDDEDKLADYIEFVKHAKSYDVFRQTRNEIHKNFPYPTALIENTITTRMTIKRRVDNFESNIGKYIKEKKTWRLLGSKNN